MNAILDFIGDFSAEQPTLVMSVLVFFAASTLAFGLMAAVRVRGSVRRRTAEILIGGSARSQQDQHTLAQTSRKAAQKIVDYTTRHYSTANDGNQQALRRRLTQAGFLDPRAPVFFLLARVVLAIVPALFVFAVFPLVFPESVKMFWPAVWIAGMVGYFAPNVVVNRRIVTRRSEHRAGFPDFMDLLVVCANAGLSMDAALTRVGRELADSYPSLSANIYMATLEMRAGRSLSDALEHLGERLGLDEARSFATLLQQSEEFGSNLSDALRVYSDDMRHKRLSSAEEKAHSLPAKLSVPLMLCVFPVVLIIIMLPVFVRLKLG
jgi:tight adherence protein C